MNKYKIAITITSLEDGGYMARCESVRATATGDTPDEAIQNVHEAIKELVQEFGEDAVFQDIQANADLRILECAI